MRKGRGKTAKIFYFIAYKMDLSLVHFLYVNDALYYIRGRRLLSGRSCLNYVKLYVREMAGSWFKFSVELPSMTWSVKFCGLSPSETQMYSPCLE